MVLPSSQASLAINFIPLATFWPSSSDVPLDFSILPSVFLTLLFLSTTTPIAMRSIAITFTTPITWLAIGFLLAIS